MTELTRTLSVTRPASRGEDVRALQRALVAAGEDPGVIDGIYGERTAAAVRRVQARFGVAETGFVTPGTWKMFTTVPPSWFNTLRDVLPGLMLEHGAPVGRGSRRWRMIDSGIAVTGENGPRRSDARAHTHDVWIRYQDVFQRVSVRYEVPVELLVATALVESNGRPGAVRREPGYISDNETPNRVSVGIAQTLISTARHTLKMPSLSAADLLDPYTSLAAAASYIRSQRDRASGPTRYDPPLVSIAYNAGSLRASSDNANAWGLIQTARGTAWHADKFIGYYGDLQDIFSSGASPAREVPSFWAALRFVN